MELFPEIGPQKIFLVPPNSAPGLCPGIGPYCPFSAMGELCVLSLLLLLLFFYFLFFLFLLFNNGCLVAYN